jgi:hypothetical protein
MPDGPMMNGTWGQRVPGSGKSRMERYPTHSRHSRPASDGFPRCYSPSSALRAGVSLVWDVLWSQDWVCEAISKPEPGYRSPLTCNLDRSGPSGYPGAISDPSRWDKPDLGPQIPNLGLYDTFQAQSDYQSPSMWSNKPDRGAKYVKIGPHEIKKTWFNMDRDAKRSTQIQNDRLSRNQFGKAGLNRLPTTATGQVQKDRKMRRQNQDRLEPGTAYGCHARQRVGVSQATKPKGSAISRCRRHERV